MYFFKKIRGNIVLSAAVIIRKSDYIGKIYPGTIYLALLMLFTYVTRHTAVLLGNSSTLNKREKNPPRCNRTTPDVLSLANPSVNAQTIFSFPAVMAFHEVLNV